MFIFLSFSTGPIQLASNESNHKFNFRITFCYLRYASDSCPVLRLCSRIDVNNKKSRKQAPVWWETIAFKVLFRLNQPKNYLAEAMSSIAFDVSEACTINGIHTEILWHKFANKCLLFITQYEKLNNVYVASRDMAFSGVLSNQMLTIKHLFGTSSDEIDCGIRYLLSQSKLVAPIQNDLEIVVCLGLKEYNPAIVKQIKGVLDTIAQKERSSTWIRILQQILINLWLF